MNARLPAPANAAAATAEERLAAFAATLELGFDARAGDGAF